MTPVPEIVPVTDLRQDASGIIKRAIASQRPVFITQRGRAAADVLSAQTYERTQHECETDHRLYASYHEKRLLGV